MSSTTQITPGFAPLPNPRPKDYTIAEEKPHSQAPPSPPDNASNPSTLVASSPRSPVSWKDVPRTRAPFSVKDRFLCYVTAVFPEYLTVQMTDERTGDNAEAEIPMDTIKPDDRNLLHAGAEFTWVFGYEAGSSFRQASIIYIPQFRRVSDERLATERGAIDTLMDTAFGPLNGDGQNPART